MLFDNHIKSRLGCYGVWVVDSNNIICDVNEQYIVMSGYSKSEIIGQPVFFFECSENSPKLQSFSANELQAVDTIHYRKDGTPFEVEISIYQLTINEGALGNSIVFINDKSSTHCLHQKMELLENIFENSHYAIMITSAKGIIEVVNKSFTDITGYEGEDVIGKTPAVLNSGRQGAEFYKRFWEALVTNGKWKGEIWNKRKNGEIFPEWLSISSIKNSEGIIQNYICQFTDITQRKRSEDEKHFQTYHDPLTLLPNRTLLFEKLAYLNDLHKIEPLKYAVLFCDVDRFKHINDSLGHTAGDELLRVIASRIDNKLRKNDFIARIGGDEFIIILKGDKAVESISAVTEQLLSLFSKPLLTEFGEFKVSISIGISQFPTDSFDIRELISFADIAMQKVKLAGGDNFTYFDENEKTSIKQRLKLENEMVSALKAGQFEVWYQPQIDARTHHVYGIECLIRWNHPVEGLITPDVFIPLAEGNGFIKELGFFVLKTGCHQLRKWRENKLFEGVLSINISLRQFERNDLVKQVRDVLEEECIPGDAIELEVTESLFSEDNSPFYPILNEIRSFGVKVAIDDFGTGYSSLQRLKELPIDNLKIDKCFVDYINTSEQDSSLIEIITLLAENFGLNIIAEGVEIEDQAKLLTKLGCYNHQGFLYSKPLNAKSLEKWLIGFRNKVESTRQ